MNLVIVYRQEDGRAAVITPTKEYMDVFGIEAIALKDVPAGQPFKIMAVADLPEEASSPEGWSVDVSTLTDGIGANYGTGSKFAVVGYADDLTPVLVEESQA